MGAQYHADQRVGAQVGCSILQGFQKAGSNFLDLGTPLPAQLPEELRKVLETQEVSGVLKFRPLLRTGISTKRVISVSGGAFPSLLMTYRCCGGSKSFGPWAASFRVTRCSPFLEYSEQNRCQSRGLQTRSSCSKEC